MKKQSKKKVETKKVSPLIIEKISMVCYEGKRAMKKVLEKDYSIPTWENASEEDKFKMRVFVSYRLENPTATVIKITDPFEKTMDNIAFAVIDLLAILIKDEIKHDVKEGEK